MRLLCITLLICGLMGSQSHGGRVSEKTIVFWIPPQIETYVPVTIENIEQMAFKTVSVKNEKQAGQILSLIQGSNQKLDSKKVRIKISTDRGFYNFDANGIGVSSKGESVKIDIQKLKQVLCE